MNTTNTFLQGRILPPLLRYILPFAASFLLQATYGLVDLWVVSQYSLPQSISAVACGAQVITFFTAIVVGLTTGGTIVMAKAWGQAKKDKVNNLATAQCVLLSFCGIVIVAVAVILAKDISIIMNIPIEAQSEMISYLRICGVGMMFVTFSNVVHSFYRSVGNSKMPLMFLASASIINLLADFVFVAWLGMGAKGAALATVVAQLLGACIAFFNVKKLNWLRRVDLKSFNISKEIKAILKVGMPVAINDVLTGISFLIVTSWVNSMGLVAATSLGIAEKMFNFLVLVPIAFLHGLAAFVAQNIGAQKPLRAKKALNISTGISLFFGVCMFSITFFAGEQLVKIFQNDYDIVKQTAEYLKAGSLEYIFLAVSYCLQGYFNGLGKTRFVMWAAVLCAFCVRVPLTVLVVIQPQATMALVGSVVSLAAGVNTFCCLMYYLYLSKKR